PEMVALFNGFGGLASLLVGWAQKADALHTAKVAGMPLRMTLGAAAGGDGRFVAATVVLAVLIGGVTFTGSLVAFGKLAGKISSKPISYPSQNLVNALGLLATLAAGAVF